MIQGQIEKRAVSAITAVLPSKVRIIICQTIGNNIVLKINGKSIKIVWIGECGLRQVRELISSQNDFPEIVVSRRILPGARLILSEVGIGWVDETGAAEIDLDSIIVSRSGISIKAPQKPPRWTPSALAVAEALLCGGKATVEAMQKITGLSTGSATYALRALTDLGLLSAKKQRGRDSGRQIKNHDNLLDAYANAATTMKPAIAITVGLTARDMIAEFNALGKRWNSAGVSWVVTGNVAASILAPYITLVTSGEIYVDIRTLVGLEWVARQANLRPIEGGRLTIRPFPTITTKQLSSEHVGLHIAPWPRVYADLKVLGVRGEEAAEHLRQVVLETNDSLLSPSALLHSKSRG